MNINWNEIKENYPKAFEKFKNKIIPAEYEYQNLDKYHICYCDLEKFFDDNGIIIDIRFNKKGYFQNYIFVEKKYRAITSTERIYDIDYLIKGKNKYNDIEKAKEQAIYKAFEIMEQQC